MTQATKKLMSVTTNGYEVYSLVNNGHMQAHKDVQEEHVKEAIAKIDHHAPFGIYEVDLGRVVGTDICVETTADDDVRLEYRVGRDILTRKVYGREPAPTTKMVVGICTDPDDELETVFTAYYGQLAPKELTDPRLTDEERPEAEAFWANHALIKAPMQFEITHIPAEDEHVKFTLNGIEGDYIDFGDVETDYGYEFEVEFSFVPDRSPSEGTLQKYGISKGEYSDVVRILYEVWG